jgi:nucleotide-binding universal stress UspA family protein
MGARHIVVGLDGSGAAHDALSWGLCLGEALHAEVVAVHGMGLLESVHNSDATVDDRRAELRDLLENTWCAATVRASCRHRVELRDGPPPEVLLAAAEDNRADLLVVGHRGVGPNPAMALGSTSLRVLQTAPVPVLVVPERGDGADEPIVLRHIVVGLDRSGPSLAALDVAADLATVLGGSLTAVEVFEQVPPFPLGPEATATSAGEEGALARTAALVEDAVRAVRTRGVAVQVIVRSGTPASTLIDIADDVDADLIVLGSRGRGGPDEMMLGSVARTVADRARRPTLVLPAAAGAVHLAPPDASDPSQGRQG